MPTDRQHAVAVRVPGGARADAKRAAILRAARECFVADGFGVNLDRVAEGAGVSKVTIYNHFGSKENLALAVIEQAIGDALDSAVALVATRLAETDDVRDDLIVACRAWVGGIGSPDMLRLRSAIAGELHQQPQLAAQWAEKGPERFHRVIGAALRALTHEGTLTIPDVELAVLQLSGLVLSPSIVYSAYGKPLAPERVDQLIVAGVDMFLAYYKG